MLEPARQKHLDQRQGETAAAYTEISGHKLA